LAKSASWFRQVRPSRPSVRAKFVSSVRPPACIDPAATERISVKFGIQDFCKNVPKKIRISLKSDKIDRGLFRIVGGVICGAKINRTPCCVSMLTMVPRTRCFFLTLYYTASLVTVLRAQNSSGVKTYSDLGFESPCIIIHSN